MRNQTVGTARVIVAPPNSAVGKEPYTLQPGLCGIEGDFLHLTPDYLSDALTPVSTKGKNKSAIVSKKNQ